MTRYALTTLTCALALVVSAGAAAAPNAGRLVVKLGTAHRYTRSELQPGVMVVCRDQGRTLSVTAPTGMTTGTGAVWPKRGTTDRGLFHLNVNVVAGKGYAVICDLGGYHSALVTR